LNSVALQLDELTESSKGRREGIQSGFGSLRAYIEQEKSLFFAKNAKVIEQIIRERVSEGIKKKLPVVVRNVSTDLSALC